MYEVSNQFKEYCKRHIRTFKSATITYYDGEEQQTIESDQIIKFDISAEPYIDYQIIGQAVAKKIHISIKGSYDLANKEINVTTTMIYDDNTEETLNLGDYIIASDYDSSVKNQCSFTGYDYMIKMDNEYSDEGLTYPCTIRDVLENICEQKDIELATEHLPNGDLEVIGNNFQDGATYRDVIKQIAQVNGTFAYIDRENKLHIDQLMNHNTLQGEGTFINLQGTTAYGNIIDYMLQGNTTQNGTPTPTTPIEVNNVTGEQVVRVCGKNLLNLGNGSTTHSGITTTCTNGEIIVNGTASANSFTQVALKTPIGWTNGTSFTISLNNPVANENVRFRVTSSGTYDTNCTNVNQTQTINYTTREDMLTTYINIRVASGTTLTSFKLKPQIEKGTSATSFEKYQGNDYEVNLGKNIYEGSANLYENIREYNQFTREDLGENVLKLTKTTSGSTSPRFFVSLVQGKNYAVQLKAKGNCTKIEVGTWVDNTQTIQANIVPNENDFTTISFTFTYSGSNPRIYIRNNDTNIPLNTYIIIKDFMIEEGSQVTSYAPYFTPIELNKIGNYQDFIKKGKGNNLADISQIQVGKGWNNTSQTQRATIVYIPIKKNKQYSFNATWTNSAITNIRAVFNYGPSNPSNNQVPSSYPYTNTLFDYVSIEVLANTTFTSAMLEGVRIMFNEGQVESYEPYGYKGKWYLEKNTGKIVLNGTESNLTKQGNNNRYGIIMGEIINNTSLANEVLTFCNYYESVTFNNRNTNNTVYTIQNGLGVGQSAFYINNNSITTLEDFKTWLTTHNTTIYYVLATPTYTLIENEELLNQLEGLNNGYTYADTTNILVSGNLPSSLNMSIDVPYRDAEEEITPSNYLTNFTQSREYGVVNKVQITMTDVEDATYIENRDSINKDGIQTITINDNYFLSSEELKAEAIRPLWNSLYTMKYMPIKCTYLGLPYIEMGDFLNVRMPNGDVKGTYVFNYKFTYNGGYMGELETPTISRTQETYPTESINSQVQKMGINVDRANARITSEIIARQETDENVTRIEQSIDEINLSVSTTQTDLSNLEGQVQTNTASIGVNADNISLAVEKNTQTQDQLDTLQTNTENVVNQLVFNGDGLTISALGSTSDDMKLNLTNEAINFMYNNNVVLKINGSTIEFANASFQKLDLGNYVWVAEDDDSLSLIYEGE